LVVTSGENDSGKVLVKHLADWCRHQQRGGEKKKIEENKEPQRPKKQLNENHTKFEHKVHIHSELFAFIGSKLKKNRFI